jgi:hypothetical protein
MPRMRERARLRARERELGQRRDEAVSEHREAADLSSQQADLAERHARIAEQEAAKQRVEAELQRERAELHEQGLADDQLVADYERDRFAGTSAVPDAAGGDAAGEPATPAEDERGANDAEDERFVSRRSESR